MIDTNTVAIVGGVLGMVFVGEYLSLGADTGKTLKPSEKKKATPASTTFRVLRGLNYVALVAFVWSTAFLVMNYRHLSHSEGTETGQVRLAKMTWTLSLIYFFSFFGITFVEKENIDGVAAESNTSGYSKPLFQAAWESFMMSCIANITIAHLCINVAYDLFVLTPPLYFLRLFTGDKIFHYCTTKLIDWTVPIVVGPPAVWCGMRVWINDLDYFEKAKATGRALVLSNHGSRIDWLIGMFAGYSGTNIRVGFVCEWLVKYLPLIGWYRNFVNQDTFVNRSFESDKPRIEKRIDEFHNSNTDMMLFLAPEGACVDHNEMAMKYINDCQKFAAAQGYKPFDYVLTPRYKGLTCLARHVKERGEIMSIAMAFVRDGKLLDERLLSPDRVVPDLYTLFEGAGGSPVHVYVYAKHLDDFNTKSPEEIKKIMMDDYASKDKLLAHFHEHGHFPGVKLDEMDEFKVSFSKVHAHILMHNLLWIATAYVAGILPLVLRSVSMIFAILLVSSVTGKFLYGSTMEAIPFETGIKALMMYMYQRKLKKGKDVSRTNTCGDSQQAY
eukprot:CAMPEP_0205916228 /NCGR_PEP_ID=MMETSP1325-20131115/8365_1 /ASSEMBLY_ACC=CAM_ASM_000708 /TAXON_ID=236786 /ORGANISM="Florenciella sp., Strain RCC1007" /LENGTH=554 /DNA_ID=CAMNT_0053283483 /DNA_START=86 /DNA_END=1750 /DNA_ORIENTATION=+